jgi:aryl-alcohol dehydrogenase-like predicted oxidoreductase
LRIAYSPLGMKTAERGVSPLQIDLNINLLYFFCLCVLCVSVVAYGKPLRVYVYLDNLFLGSPLEGSLKRLNTDYIDLFWLHAWDFTTPIEEVLRSLDDLVRQGKVLYIGISDTPAWIISQANTIAHYQGWTQFVALQIEYSLIHRTPERDSILFG